MAQKAWRGEALGVFGEFVLVGKHPIATIDVAPGKWLRCLLKESCQHFLLVRLQLCKPGVGQRIGRGRSPVRAGDTVALTQVFSS